MKLRERWQRFLDGSSKADPYKDVPVRENRAPRSHMGQGDPMSELAASGPAVYAHQVPQEHLYAHCPEVQAIRARRVHSEKHLGPAWRQALADMDQLAGELYRLRQAARRVHAWADLPRVRRHDRYHARNMARYEVTGPGQGAHGTLFISDLKHRPRSAHSLNETMPHAWEIVDRALHAHGLLMT